jgi:hypothetical protein
VAGDEPLTIYRMQFHAEREELIAYIAGWVGWHGLAVVAERFFPEYEPVAIPPNVGLRDAVAHLEPVRRLCLARSGLDFGCGFITNQEFMTVNPDCLAIALEPVTEDGLRETALATLTENRDTLAFWLKLVLELDEVMHQGATAIDPRTGSLRYFASHRHTPGAHELASSGVRMLACAGDTYFEFADVEVHDEQLAC